VRDFIIVFDFPTMVKGNGSVVVRVIGRMCAADDGVIQEFYARIFGGFHQLFTHQCDVSSVRPRGLLLVSLCSLSTERYRASAKPIELCFGGNRDDHRSRSIATPRALRRDLFDGVATTELTAVRGNSLSASHMEL
jgi:hypothetical protein